MVLTKQLQRLTDPGYLVAVYLKFSPPVLALIFDLPAAQKHWKSHGKQLEEGQPKDIEDSDLGCMILSDDKMAMHYAAAELDSVPVAQRLYNYGYLVNYSYYGPGGMSSKVPDWLRVSPLYSVQSTQMQCS